MPFELPAEKDLWSLAVQRRMNDLRLFGIGDGCSDGLELLERTLRDTEETQELR